MAQMGRPRFLLSDDDFDKLVGMIRIQCTELEICSIFGVTYKTLNRALERRGEPTFSYLYEKHSGEGKASLRRMQWQEAMNGNTTMLVWLGKQALGQRDERALSVRGNVELAPPSIDTSKLSLGALKELRAAMIEDQSAGIEDAEIIEDN